jgi:adenylosuccinate lyase
MLGEAGIVRREESETLVNGLKQLLIDLESGELDFSTDLEDVHTNVEHILTQRIGEAGKRLHTARSRNDQVSTDLRMFVRDAILEVVTLLLEVQEVLVDRAEKETGTIMPGFTHLQHAQPVSLGFPPAGSRVPIAEGRRAVPGRLQAPQPVPTGSWCPGRYGPPGGPGAYLRAAGIRPSHR